jgi:plastocyanin
MKNLSPMRWLLAMMTLAILAAAGCGGDDSDPGPQVPAADVTIEIVANNGSSSYAPSPTTVLIGKTVAWHNAHSMTHTATADGGAFNTGNLAPGATSQPFTVTTAGSFPYHCGLHPSMVGTLTVVP